MDVLNAANKLERAGHPVFHLEAGQPSTKAPGTALDAASDALRGQTLGYTEALGIPALRDRISRHYKDWYKIDVPSERVVVTTGSSAGFVFAFLLLFDPGQTLAIANPGYPAYRNISKALGIRTALIECKQAAQFRLTAEMISQAGDIDGVLLASPSNPCGTVISPEELQRIADYAEHKKIHLISDEIYHGISYGPHTQTVLAFSRNAIVINSFSKYFSMTGWRIGWMVVPEAMVDAVERVAQNFYISPPAISQIAATAAFDARLELEGHVRTYAANREVLLEALKNAGLNSIAPADGAFYLYADISDFAMSADDFTRKLLAATGVAATPGDDFDPLEGSRWVRFSYAGGRHEIQSAANLISSWCAKLKGS
ncbi:MAG: aminotransferase class I/II-fold pyridoxal phosphate-dependent enzyme [Micropepsaceae bacterium]